MKRAIGSLLAVSLLLSGSAFAQQPPPQDHDHDRDSRHQPQPARDDRGPQHPQDRGEHGRQPPKRGERLAEGQRGDRVSDYRRHGLKKPPRGHEWRKVDDRYVLIAVATGLITSVIAAHH